MRVHPPFLVAVLAALVLCVVAANTASAASYLHNGTTTGNVLASGTELMSAGTGAVSFSGDIRPWSCTASTLGATAGASGGASITPTLNSITFSSCHTPGTTVYAISTCHTIAPLPTITATATGEAGGTVTLHDLWFRCGIVSAPAPYGCHYRATTAVGNYSNSGATLSYTGVSLQHTAPAGSTDLGGLVCSNGGSFSMSFNDLVVVGSGSTVVLNTTS